MSHIAINGKFLAARPTGVHRVARELIDTFGRLLSHDKFLQKKFKAEILQPRDVQSAIETSSLKHRTVGVLTWQFWEQFELPLYARDSLLLNLCNLSPITKKNAITMIHDAQVFITPESYSKPFVAWYQHALPRIGKINKKILTVSEYSKTQLVKWGIADEEKVEVIHNGVEHVLRAKRNDDIIRRLNLSPNAYSIALANTQAHKNIKVLIEAYSHPDLRDRKLVLFGGATKDAFEKCGVFVPDNIVFAGFVSDSELRSLLENANAMLFPSLTEGFGLPPLEAMLLGTPAICAECGALPEVCGSETDYVRPDAPNEWANRILELISEPPHIYQNRSEAAIQHAQQFTWDKAGRTLIDVLLNCDV